MRVHLSGSRSFGAAVLDAVQAAGHKVTGVTSPGYRQTTVPWFGGAVETPLDALHAAADRRGLPWTERLSPDTVTGADVLVSAHSHAFAGRRTRAAVEYSIGYHPSLLPLHRGRDAVRWTIRDRDRIAGGTVYHLTDVVDGGPVAAQDWCFVRPDDTAASLWRRELLPMGLRLLVHVLADLDAGRVVYVPQDAALATWEPALDPPRLYRPELLELPAPGGAGPVYVVDPVAARRGVRA